jgi:hypothetical protein
MVEIGHSKFGHNNRISLVEGLPEILNLSLGDYVVFLVENGNLIIRKETKTYSGIDFEGDEIKERLIELENSKIEEIVDTWNDPDEIMRKAREAYERDKEKRKSKRN